MRTVIMALALAAGAVAAPAQELGDRAAGLRLAQAWCSECHLVEEGRVQQNAARPPSFSTIANRAEVTPVWLNVFFQTPHPVMPNIMLTPGQRDDIAAHILSLKRR